MADFCSFPEDGCQIASILPFGPVKKSRSSAAELTKPPTTIPAYFLQPMATNGLHMV